MVPWFALLAAAAALLLLAFSAYRSRELLVLAVRDGRTQVTRGRAPPGLVSDLSDVFARSQVRSAKVTLLREGDHIRLTATGLDEHALQRARNVLGTYPAHKFVAPRH